jgi:hypothetical protein
VYKLGVQFGQGLDPLHLITLIPFLPSQFFEKSLRTVELFLSRKRFLEIKFLHKIIDIRLFTKIDVFIVLQK